MHFQQYRQIRTNFSTVSVVQSSRLAIKLGETRRIQFSKTELNYKHTYNELLKQGPKDRSLRPEGPKAGVWFLGRGWAIANE